MRKEPIKVRAVRREKQSAGSARSDGFRRAFETDLLLKLFKKERCGGGVIVLQSKANIWNLFLMNLRTMKLELRLWETQLGED